MKTNKTAATIIVVSVLLSASVVSTNALASGKLKPPVAESKAAASWYQPVFDFFTFA
jgi:hypothetical protein